MTTTKPDYYQGKKGDVIDFMYSQYGEDADIFMVGNIIKYTVRHKEKNGVEDLEKAATYLERLTAIEREREEAKHSFMTGIVGGLKRVAEAMRRWLGGPVMETPVPPEGEEEEPWPDDYDDEGPAERERMK